MYKRVKTAVKYIPNLKRFGINTILSLYYSGFISRGVALNLLKRKYLLQKQRKKKKQVIKKKKQVIEKVKKKQVKKIKKPVKKIKKPVKKIVRSQNWFPMSVVLPQYENDYPNLKFHNSADIFKFYRNRTRKYYKLLNIKPALPNFNKRVKKYYVYAILKAKEVSPSIDTFNAKDFVLKKFVWKNKEMISIHRQIKLLLAYHPLRAKEDFYQMIEDTLHRIFMRSEKYEVREFVGVYFKV